MPWPTSLALYVAAVTPDASAGNGTELLSLITAGLNLGVLGIVFWLFVGGHLHSDREVGRQDDELNRVLEDKRRAEEQRDEALRITHDEVVPILKSFVDTTTALIPLLQELVRRGRSR
jgi:hypothetical protein